MSTIRKNHYITLLAKGSFISFIGTVILGLLNYLIRRQLALNLSFEDFGFLYGAMSMCMIFLAYLDLGLNQSATILISKSLSQEDIADANSIYNQIFTIKLVFSVIIYIAILASYKYWLSHFFHYDKIFPFIIIMTLIITQAIYSIPLAALTALKKFFLLNLTQLLNPLLILLILICFKDSISTASAAFPVASILLFLITVILIRKFNFSLTLKKMINTNGISNIFHLSKWVAISTAGLSTMYYMDSIMLTYLKGLEAVALYNIALPIVQIAQSMTIIPAVFIPIVSEMWIRKNFNEIADISKLISGIILYMLWPIMISIIFSSKYLIIILFAEKYLPVKNPLIVLFAGIIFYILGTFYMGVLNSGSEAKKVSISIIIVTIINILLNFCLIPFIGISGAALATAISYFLIAFYLFFLMKAKLGKYVLHFRQLIYSSLAGLICMLCSIPLANLSIKSDILYFISFNLLYLGITIPILKSYFKMFLKYWQGIKALNTKSLFIK
jgi:O-antigen/teichoic acid export membrane protein